MASLRLLRTALLSSQQLWAGSGHLTQILPACAQVAARTPWASKNAWAMHAPPNMRTFASKKNTETAEAAEATGATSGSEQEAAAAADQAAADEAAASVDVSELQELLDKAQEEAASFKDRWQRSHAEMQNLIARQAREKETMQTYAVQKFAQSLLEVADNLESAAKAVPKDALQPGAEISTEKALAYLKSLLEGVQATERVLLKTMGAKGVQRIETAEGDPFDPNLHEAMSTVPATSPDHKPGAVAMIWQSGYRIHDRILRAAKVIVYQE